MSLINFWDKAPAITYYYTLQASNFVLLVSVNDVRRHVLWENMASELIHMPVKKACVFSTHTQSNVLCQKVHRGHDDNACWNNSNICTSEVWRGGHTLYLKNKQSC